MNWLNRLLKQHELDRQLDSELRFHREQLIEDYRRKGLTAEEAQRQVQLELGGLDQAKEQCRDARGTLWLEAIAQDFRFALRGFANAPGFAFSAVTAITLAVGCATAVFSVVDRSLFRPLPYAHSDRLVSIGIVAPVVSTQDWLFAGTYFEWKRAIRAFDSMTAWKPPADCDRNDGQPERLACTLIEPGFLPTLGVVPIIGRNLSSPDEALITYGFWQSKFGGNPDVLGKRITIDGAAASIAGVLPASFETPTLAPTDVLLPLKLREGAQRQRLVNVIARVRPELNLRQALEHIQPQYQQFLKSVPPDFRNAAKPQLRVESLRDQQTRGYKLALWMLLGAALSFVLIACANVAHLLLAKSSARKPEFAIRASLGASAFRLAGQALTESAVLGMAGGITGIGLAFALLHLFQMLAPAGSLRMDQAGLDLRVLVFALALSLAAAFIFGLAPAIERMRGERLMVNRSVGPSRTWLRSALVALQLAISVVLLSGTGLFLLSLRHLQQARLGFTPERCVTASFVLPPQRYADPQRQMAFFNDLEQRLREVPGFSAAAITDSLPPGGDPRSRPFFALLGRGKADDKEFAGVVKWRYVTRGYFETLGIRIEKGRAFADEDRASGSQPVVMSASLARRLYGQADPLGKQLKLDETTAEVVGIAAEVQNSGLRGSTDPEFYLLRQPIARGAWNNQRPPFGWRKATAVVRTTLTSQFAMQSLQQAIHQMDSTLALTTSSFEGELQQYVAAPRFQTALLSLFAIIGLLLAALGLYGLTSFLVVERTREVGVRIALGATPATIIRMMMSASLSFTVTGVVLGTFTSIAVARLLRTLLFEVEPLDHRVFATAIGLLVTVALIGTWLPSLRASRVDPMEALRQE